MKRRADKSTGGFYKYLIISILIHGIVLYLFGGISFGTRPSFVQQSYSESQLIRLERVTKQEQDNTKAIASKQTKDENKEKREETKDKEEETKAQQEHKLDDKQEKSTSKNKKTEVKKKKAKQAKSVIITNESKDDKKRSKNKTSKSEATLNQKDQANQIDQSGQQETSSEKEKSEQVLTSKQSSEEIKVAKKEEKKETSEKKKDSKVEKNKEQVKDSTAQQKKPEPPPAPKAMVGKLIVPTYPKNASNVEIEGDVILLAEVKGTGKLEQINVLQSSGDKRLDSQARRTIKYGWEFNSYNKDYEIELIVHFQNKDQQQQVDVEFVELSFEK